MDVGSDVVTGNYNVKIVTEGVCDWGRMQDVKSKKLSQSIDWIIQVPTERSRRV